MRPDRRKRKGNLVLALSAMLVSAVYGIVLNVMEAIAGVIKRKQAAKPS